VFLFQRRLFPARQCRFRASLAGDAPPDSLAAFFFAAQAFRLLLLSHDLSFGPFQDLNVSLEWLSSFNGQVAICATLPGWPGRSSRSAGGVSGLFF